MVIVIALVCLFVGVGCVIYSRKKTVNITSDAHINERFEMAQNPVYAIHDPIYDECIPTVNNSAYDQVALKRN